MSVTTSDRPTLGVAQRPFRRSSTNSVLGGVCGGLAVRLGIRERTLRIAFCLATFVFSSGLVAYVALWLLVPRSGEDESVAQRLSKSRRKSSLFIALVVSALAILAALYVDRQGGFGKFFVPFALSMVGLVAVWWGSSSDEQSHLKSVLAATPLRSISTARGGRAIVLRVLPGLVLVVLGLIVLGRIGGVWGAAVPAIIGAGVVVVGGAIIFAPWWLETVRDLTQERRERVRAEERSAMVAHLHDSVLQTLTLIERVAGNEGEVRRLARNQERELRQWLYNPTAHATSSATFASMLRSVEADVEDDYGISVELVVVGDCAADETVTSLVRAAREAALNAAKWSGAPAVSIFGEVEPGSISIFVRDTGTGFDRAQVPSDRHGITASIEERTAKVGGTATLTSALGRGTEVTLVAPRKAP